MKVLHITNEFTKKNFSISSLILYISNYLYEKYNFKFSILTSIQEKELFDNKHINIFNLDSWFDFFVKKKKLSEEILKYDIVHIHGIWAPIQLISIIVCNNLNKNFVIHPHGMLLPEAMSGGGIFKYFFKLFFLVLFRYFINNRVNFVSITQQEKNAIKKFFPNSSVTEISNPIPFKKDKISTQIKRKRLVYFGRIHPHKNLDLVVKAFKKADLNDEWKLDIYGIKDDQIYYEKLKKIIGSNKQINIKDPVFGQRKQAILEESWINILVSKSEVLSLSILESSTHKLPSLVNENIETTGLEDSIISTETKLESITKNIKKVCNWTLEERLKIGENISDNVEKKTSIEKISKNYENLYHRVNLEDKIYKEENQGVLNFLFPKNIKFLIVTSTYMFNLMFSSFIVIALVILGHYSIAGELGLVTSFWITLTQIFSSNMRSIVISEQKTQYAIMTMVYRIIFSIIFLIISYFLLSTFINFENTNLIILFSILIMVQWINEMNLSQAEVQNKFGLFKIFTLINLLTVIASSIFLYFSYFNYFNYLILTYVVFIFVSFYAYYLELFKIIYNLNFKKIIELNLKTIAFLSSFSIVISSFAWRIMIYFIFDKSLAGVFFACFSIGSFPGTLFNSVIGPAFVKQKIEISRKLKSLFFLLFMIILLSVVISFYLIISKNEIDYLAADFISFTISLSLIGSYFMSYAMYLRHKKIQSSLESRFYLFKKDIFYGISITFLIPILYFLGNVMGVSFSFFMASIVALVSYSFEVKNFKVKLFK